MNPIAVIGACRKLGAEYEVTNRAGPKVAGRVFIVGAIRTLTTASLPEIAVVVGSWHTSVLDQHRIFDSLPLCVRDDWLERVRNTIEFGDMGRRFSYSEFVHWRQNMDRLLIAAEERRKA